MKARTKNSGTAKNVMLTAPVPKQTVNRFNS